MGRVRTKTVKRASRVIVEKFYPRLTLDFHTNKRIIDEITLIASKRLRNKVAGCVTHIMKRIRNGPVRGISIKLQDEEKEKRDMKEPEKSAIEEDDIVEIDEDTKEMIDLMGMSDLSCIQVIVSNPGEIPIPEPVIRAPVMPVLPLSRLREL